MSAEAAALPGPARVPTMYLIGVTKAKSSIMRVFPAWARHLGLDALLCGIDFPPAADPARYRAAVAFLKSDPLSLGALVTTHKVNFLNAARALFDDLDPYALTLHEVSAISKRAGRLIGHGNDPVTAGTAFGGIVPPSHLADSGGEICILGAGASSLALTFYPHEKARAGGDVPARVTVTARRQESLDEMAAVHCAVGFALPADYRLTHGLEDADRLVAAQPPGSMVANATGLGKDAPGSPLTAAARFPCDGFVWELNSRYRGDLLFLRQAQAAAAVAPLTVADGWVYFLHGWTRVIAEVFDIEIPMLGPAFDELGRIAAEATTPTETA